MRHNLFAWLFLDIYSFDYYFTELFVIGIYTIFIAFFFLYQFHISLSEIFLLFYLTLIKYIDEGRIFCIINIIYIYT